MNEPSNGQVQIATLNPAPYNPRTITAEALDGLAASIRNGTKHAADWDASQGYRLDTTITVNRQGRRIIGGHQRVKALLEKLGQPWVHKGDITWIDVEPDSPAEKGRNVALNSGLIAGDWTPDVLGLLGDIGELPDVADMRLDMLRDELDMRFVVPLEAEGQELDESVADDVQMTECPSCGHKFPV